MDLKNSLDVINKAVAQGNLGDNHLLEANRIYKQKINFKETAEYKLAKSLTLNDFIKTGNSNQELMKALTIGETKVGNDGKTYIVVKAPNGNLDWRILKKDKKSDKDDEMNSLFDNDDFPKDSSEFTVQNVPLSGSTGAKLVKDKNGVEYVMKAGASQGHVEEEFLANSLYRTVGLDTPEMKIYRENGKTFILSKFVPNTRKFDDILRVQDKISMKSASEGFVMDCLLGNWDAYKNDNILVANGVAIRVDNGGSLRYRAQGGLKNNFSNTVDELTSMVKHNSWIGAYVNQNEMIDQIQEILGKEKEILSLIDDPNLKSLMKSRMVYLKGRIPNKKKTQAQKKIDGDDKYRELTQKELEDAYDSVDGNLYKQKDGVGWEFLSEVCKMRGFDGVPEVLEEADFDALLKDKDNIYTNRGMTSAPGLTAKQCMLSYTEGEECFYGYTGIHGQGIYSAINQRRVRDLTEPAFHTATMHYAGGKMDQVLDIIIPKEAKTITKKKARELMDEEFFGQEFKDKKLEFDAAEKNILKLMSDVDKEKDAIEDRVKKEKGWNETTLDYLVFQQPEVQLADTKKTPVGTVLTKMEEMIHDLSGTWNQVDDTNYEIKLPNSQKKFNLNIDDFDNALKQKNSNSPVYNFRLLRLKNFIIEEHFNKIKDKIDNEIKTALKTDSNLISMEAKIKQEKVELAKIESEVNSLKKNGSSAMSKVIGKIIKSGSSEMYGVYAAVKGYDVLIAEGGNGDCDYAVILNRSITKVKKFT